MTEKPSQTCNHQRLQEMMCHLTPAKAVVPYSVCLDGANNLWVASKGGLFKFDPTGSKLLFHRRNEFPRRMAPYTQVVVHRDKVIYVTCDDKAALSEFQILSLDGALEHEHFIDGKVQSLAINQQGDMFLTKQPMVGAEESCIWKSNLDCPLGWEPLCTSTSDECFQALCAFDDQRLAVAVSSIPVNIYSKQSIKWLCSATGQVLGQFSSAGKSDGQVFFPRCLRRSEDSLLVLDKTGRIQRFSGNGTFERVAAKIDDFLGNGFALLREGEALIACSGIVQTRNGESVCDDWLEAIKLDGTRWTPSAVEEH